MFHGVRRVCQSDAYTTLGSPGSSTTSIAPVFGFGPSTLVQCAPPSIDLNTPRSGFGPYGWPRAAT